MLFQSVFRRLWNDIHILVIWTLDLEEPGLTHDESFLCPIPAARSHE